MHILAGDRRILILLKGITLHMVEVFMYIRVGSDTRYSAKYRVLTGYPTHYRITVYCVGEKSIVKQFLIKNTIRVGPYVCMSVQTSICMSVCKFDNLQYIRTYC